MADYRAAIIGCGNIAGRWNDNPSVSHVLTHAKAFEKHPNTTMVACCDFEKARATEFCHRWGIAKWYLSVEEMLSQEDIDIVSVCVPTVFHREIVRKIVEARSGTCKLRLVLLEKPVAVTVSDARAVAADLARAGLACNVNYIRRFDQVLQSVKGIITEGKMGNIQQFRARYTKGLLNNGSHLINLLRFYFGEIGQWNILDHFLELDKDPTVSLFLMFRNGAKGIIQGLKEECYSLFDLDIMLEKGMVSVNDFGNRVGFMRAGPDPVFPSYQVLQGGLGTTQTNLLNAVYYYLDNSIKALEGKEEFISPIADAIGDVTFCAAVREALYS